MSVHYMYFSVLHVSHCIDESNSLSKIMVGVGHIAFQR